MHYQKANTMIKERTFLDDMPTIYRLSASVKWFLCTIDTLVTASVSGPREHSNSSKKIRRKSEYFNRAQSE